MNKPAILIVEDDWNNQRLMEVLVRKNGWEPVSVSSGKDALARIKIDSFAVILMDWRLPDMSGLDCVREMRQFEARANRYTPVIAVTANAMESHQTECLNAGMDDYLSKPFLGAELLDMVQRWIDERPVVQTQPLTQVK